MMGHKGTDQLYWTYEINEKDEIGVFADNKKPPNMVLKVLNEQVIGSFFGTAL